MTVSKEETRLKLKIEDCHWARYMFQLFLKLLLGDYYYYYNKMFISWTMLRFSLNLKPNINQDSRNTMSLNITRYLTSVSERYIRWNCPLWVYCMSTEFIKAD